MSSVPLMLGETGETVMNDIAQRHLMWVTLKEILATVMHHSASVWTSVMSAMLVFVYIHDCDSI